MCKSKSHKNSAHTKVFFEEGPQGVGARVASVCFVTVCCSCAGAPVCVCGRCTGWEGYANIQSI